LKAAEGIQIGAPAIAIAGCLALAACASFVDRRDLVTGTSETLTIDSDPAGADCSLLRGSDLIGRLITPGTVAVTTSADDITLLCKKQDYEVSALLLHADSDQASVQAGALIGWGLDIVSSPHYLYAPATKLSLIASREPPDSDYSQAVPTSELSKPGAMPAQPKSIPAPLPKGAPPAQ
jgi:hypothetical protein